MHLEYLKNEKQWGDAPFRPDLKGAVLEGKRGRILVTILRAGGEGKHPTILLAHGIPGVEKNLDLAQGLRRVGFHVVTYHYSGSWNSAGEYGIGHCLEDSETVLEYIRNDTEMNFDTEKLYVVGHSMGVFIFQWNYYMQRCAPGQAAVSVARVVFLCYNKKTSKWRMLGNMLN